MPQLMSNVSKGWSRDGNPPTHVQQEQDVSDEDIIDDEIGGGGGFLDLD